MLNVGNRQVETIDNSNGWKYTGILFAIFSIVPLSIGFHKMFMYRNSEYYPSNNVNVYVNGDAYNYIINANYATGFFVLAGIMIMIALGCGVLWYLAKIRINSFSRILEKKDKINEIHSQNDPNNFNDLPPI